MYTHTHTHTITHIGKTRARAADKGKTQVPHRTMDRCRHAAIDISMLHVLVLVRNQARRLELGLDTQCVAQSRVQALAMLTQLPVICYLVHVPFACPSCALARFQLCNCLFTSSRLVEGVQARGAHCSAVTTAQQAHTRLLQHEAPACIFNAMSEHVSACKSACARMKPARRDEQEPWQQPSLCQNPGGSTPS